MINYGYESYFSEDSIQTDIIITDGTVTYSGTSPVITGYTILIRNSDLHLEEMSLIETLCSEKVLHFGACESSEYKFNVSGNMVPLEGKVLNAYLYFNHDASTLFKIGTYKVYSDVATAQKSVREITCYDLLMNVLNNDYTGWYNSLDFTTVNTVKKFRDAFFAHVGITQKAVALVNDSAPILKVTVEGLSGAMILRAICEANGRFGHMNRDNEFVYVKLEQNIQGLYPAVDLYPSPDLYPRRPKSTPIQSGSYIPPLKYEKYKVPSITRLQIRTDDSDIGVVVGSAGTDYVIQGNFLLFNLNATQLTSIANNILGEISGVVFQPFETRMRADLCLEVGDAIRCNDSLTGVEGYIFYRNVVGIQAMIDTFNCYSDREYKLNANSVGYQFNAVNNRTARLKTDIDEVSVELTYQLDPTAGEPGGTHNSYAYQTAQEIGSKVETSTYNTFVNTTYSTFVTQTNNAIDQRVTKTDFNYQLDPTQAGGGGLQESYAHQTADQIALKVSDSNLLTSLNSKISSVSITANGFDFQSTGSIIINTSNFTLDANGNATFSGTLASGISIYSPVISGGSMSSGSISGGTITGASFECRDANNNRTTWIDADGSLAQFADGLVAFYGGVSQTTTEIRTQTVTIYTDEEGFFEVACGASGTLIECSEEYDSLNDEYTEGVYIGCDNEGAVNADEVALNANTWIHVGYASPSIVIGSSQYTSSISINASSVTINGSSVATSSGVSSQISSEAPGVVDSHYGTQWYTKNNLQYLKWTLPSFARLEFYSERSLKTVSLNDIIDACGL